MSQQFSGPAKVIAIGLDSADRSLVDKWCASGDLPTLQSLRQRGTHAPLEPLAALGDDAVWASFSTGLPPGQHGRHYWQTMASGAYDERLAREQQLARPPFWATLGESGKRVAVIDVPKNPLVPGLNGIQVVDWQVHGRDLPRAVSWPPDLADSLVASYGEDQIDRSGKDSLCSLYSLPHAAQENFPALVLQGLQRKSSFLSETLARGGWDLFLPVFKEAHCIGHQFGGRLEQVRKIYRALDQAAGELVAQAGPHATVIVFSLLGMGVNNTGEHLLERVLRRLEPVLSTPAQRLRLARGRMVQGMRALLTKVSLASRYRAARLFYQTPHNEMSGAIRLNLAGREPSGIVQPGAEYDRLLHSLSDELRALRDPASGRALVESILLTDQAYPGPRRDQLPDLFVVWNRDFPINGATSPRIGELLAAQPPYRAGNHTAGGFYIAAGPGILPGEASQPSSILDLAPSIAHLLGADLPGVAGRPWAALSPVCQG